MKRSIRSIFFAFSFLAILVSACAPASTPPPTVVPPTFTQLPTDTPLPTETPVPTDTPAPTATPAPLCGTVASSLSTAPSTDPSKQFGKFEPPDGEVYFGFTYKLWDVSPPSQNAKWGDVRAFSERICDSVEFELGGKTPTLIKVQSEWTAPFGDALADFAKIHAALGPTVVPMLEWQSKPGITTKDIASGQLDPYITQYARDVKQYGQPLFIRLICGEFNGSWWEWCSPKANPDLTGEDFVNAWRHVVDIFRQEQVTNVAWLWTPVAFPPPPQDWGRDPHWQDYYPGDEYVDWVGSDLNDWGKPKWLDPIYQFGIDHQKPFFLAEFAIRHEGTNLTHQQELNWLNAMFDFVESHPQIKAISYFNYRNNPDPDPTAADHVFLYDGKVSYVPDVSDHDQRLIAGGEDIRALFASRIADPRYVSTLGVGP
jgi:mannan endo-1,4-beta-mannosidase